MQMIFLRQGLTRTQLWRTRRAFHLSVISLPHLLKCRDFQVWASMPGCKRPSWSCWVTLLCRHEWVNLSWALCWILLIPPPPFGISFPTLPGRRNNCLFTYSWRNMAFKFFFPIDNIVPIFSGHTLHISSGYHFVFRVCGREVTRVWVTVHEL